MSMLDGFRTEIMRIGLDVQGQNAAWRGAIRAGLIVVMCTLIQIVSQRGCRAETALDIEQHALQQREQITRGHISLVARMMKVKDVKGGAPTETTTEREFYFDGDRLRCDTSTRSGADVATIRVSCFGCDPFGHVAWVNGSTGKRDEPLLIFSSSEMEVNKHWFIPPPAELGMIPLEYGMALNFPMDAYLTRADRESPTLETTELDGVVCFRISYTTFNKTKIDEWISADRGYSVIGMDERFQNHTGAEYHDSLRSTVELHEPSGIWFPVSLHYQRTINANLFTREQVDISVHSLNTELDPGVFSLGGIKQLSPGTRVLTYCAEGEIDKERMEWDGRKIVKSKIAGSPPNSQFRWMLFWGQLAVFLALASLFYIRRYSQSQRADH